MTTLPGPWPLPRPGPTPRSTFPGRTPRPRRDARARRGEIPYAPAPAGALNDHVRGCTAKTPPSKRIAQRYRRVLADSRAAVGFRGGTKEMPHPIAGRRAGGARLEEVDGNEYVDITMGFGVLLFGHEPDFVTEAVREHLSRGVQYGTRTWRPARWRNSSPN